MLSIAAGLVEATSGGVAVGGRQIDGPGPDRGVVFQSPCLLPWLTALDNVRLGVDQVFARLKRQRAHRPRRANARPRRASRAPSASARPSCPRACGSAWASPARSPSRRSVLLLDEPFGMLDSLTRMELQDVLLDLLAREPKTVLMVTHDVDEALFLSDRVAHDDVRTGGPPRRTSTCPFRGRARRHAVL